MSQKDVNIKVSAEGADDASQKIRGLGNAAEQMGQKVSTSARQASDNTDKHSASTDKLANKASKLTDIATKLVGAWLGLQGVMKLLDAMEAKLTAIDAVQRKLYEGSMSLAEVGRGLVFQTGQAGKDQYWTEQALKLQESGGLKDAQTAQQMLVSMDIAFGPQGGIKNPQIRKMAQELAPFVGAAGLSGDQVTKVFEFAGIAGVNPDTQSYKEYFAKLQAGYTSSKATDFGMFMEGLQKGGTAMLAQGSTLDTAISTFASARSVTANEALASNALQQMSRLSSGAYEKPRVAIEKNLGVKWSDMNADSRLSALLQYTGSLDSANREQVMAEEGFPTELITMLSKMTSREAVSTMAQTRKIVGSASGTTVDKLGSEYLKSTMGRASSAEAQRQAKSFGQGQTYADWQQRLADSREEFDRLLAEGRDRTMIPDKIEPTVIAMESLLKDIEAYEASAQGSAKEDAATLKEGLSALLSGTKAGPNITDAYGAITGEGSIASRAGQYGKAFELLQQSAPTIITDNSIHYHPTTGEDQTKGERLRP